MRELGTAGDEVAGGGRIDACVGVVDLHFSFVNHAGEFSGGWSKDGPTDKVGAGRNIKAGVCSTAMHRSPQIEGRLRIARVRL